jgi:hypothetical protein
VKSILAGIIAAAIIALGAWAVLDGTVQRSALPRTTAEGVPL